jgi:hypothetical protein
LPEEAALSFVSIGEVLGASTQDAVVPELKPLEKVLNWFLYILGF